MAANQGARLTYGPYASCTPAGTTQATATPINADTVMLTGGTTGQGVILNPMELNTECMICNGDSTVEYYVYPQVGGKINNFTANTPVLVGPNKACRFRAINSLDVFFFI
jgi:hypothetical protein